MTKQKTFLTFLALSFLSLPLAATAKTYYCPFTDKFAINIPKSGKILDALVQGNVSYTYLSDTFFTLGCANDRNVGSGDVTMNVGFDDTHKCTIILHDGPYVINPSVTVLKCDGEVNFNGIEGLLGSHNYTLYFSG